MKEKVVVAAAKRDARSAVCAERQRTDVAEDRSRTEESEGWRHGVMCVPKGSAQV